MESVVTRMQVDPKLHGFFFVKIMFAEIFITSVYLWNVHKPQKMLQVLVMFRLPLESSILSG